MFTNRADAGRRLAAEVVRAADLPSRGVVVLGLPRGGVPVGYHVAVAVRAPLDVLVVRKLGVPYMPELAMGAIGEGGAKVINEDVVSSLGVSVATIAEVEARERAELDRRVALIRSRCPAVPLEHAVAVVVDDGIATGATAAAACAVARAHGASRVLLAAPVAAADSVRGLHRVCDGVLAVEAPRRMSSIGRYYRDFSPVSEHEVLSLLERRAAEMHGEPATAALDEDVEIPCSAATVQGHLSVPAAATGIVVFAHGSGSGRASLRNRAVADALGAAGIGALLLDLLSGQEGDGGAGFDLPLLAGRLRSAVAWVREQPSAHGLPVGLFGGSTGAAVALAVAADPLADIAAVVCRGGRTDLAGARVPSVTAPTLLIVGGEDATVLDINRRTQPRLGGPARLETVAGAGHLFEEPGAMEAVIKLATNWFTAHLHRGRSTRAAGRPAD